MKITVEKVMEVGICDDYTERDVHDLVGDGIDHTEILELDIPVEDKLWALMCVCMSSRQQRHFACDCVERKLRRERAAGREPDERSWHAVEVARRYADGEATRCELDRARAAAWDAYRPIAYAARGACATACTAAYIAVFAARAAAYTVSIDANDTYTAVYNPSCSVRAIEAEKVYSAVDSAWQIQHALEMIEEVENENNR